jgi:hypothetical protein
VIIPPTFFPNALINLEIDFSLDNPAPLDFTRSRAYLQRQLFEIYRFFCCEMTDISSRERK